METTLKLLQEYWIGALILIVLLVFTTWTITYIFTRLSQIFGWGNYKDAQKSEERSSSYLIADFFSNLINDFRHLLALLLIIIFFIILMYSMVTAKTHNDLIDVIKTIVASLGTLVGSVIGYYYGEARNKKEGAESPTINIVQNAADPEKPITPLKTKD